MAEKWFVIHEDEECAYLIGGTVAGCDHEGNATEKCSREACPIKIDTQDYEWGTVEEVIENVNFLIPKPCDPTTEATPGGTK